VIPSAAQATRYLRGAGRLFRFDARGQELLDRSPEGFWQSFWCAVLIAPPYALLLALRADSGAEAQRAAAAAGQPFWRVAAVETIAYVIGWVAYPLVMAYLAPLIDRAERYFGYFAAYNWCAAPQLALMVAVAVMRASGLLPGALMGAIEIGALFYALGVLWFLARTLLDVSRGTAALIVVIDFLLNQLVYGIGRAMLG
jgi:hypothetical protein